jgi:hypothetical protein
MRERQISFDPQLFPLRLKTWAVETDILRPSTISTASQDMSCRACSVHLYEITFYMHDTLRTWKKETLSLPHCITASRERHVKSGDPTRTSRAVIHNAFMNMTKPEHSVAHNHRSLLRACSSSAAFRAAGLHTHVRTHRTSSDPAYLHTYVYWYMKGEEGECCYFWNPDLKKNFRVTASLKTATPESGSKFG